jgi:trigger factor
VERERERNARATVIDGRVSQNGDNVIIDYEGFIDGVPFDGGKANDYNLKLGSGALIPGFEEQLAGRGIGEEFEMTVTFPENYGVESLKGKPAVFKVTLKEIQLVELPELDDEFAQDVSDFNTLEEYKNDAAAKIRNEKEENAKIKKENQLLQSIIDETDIDIPNCMIEEQLDTYVNDLKSRLDSAGIRLENYERFTGIPIKDYREQQRPFAKFQVAAGLILETIAKLENVNVGDEELDKEIAKLAEELEMSPEEFKQKYPFVASGIKIDLTKQKALDIIITNAIEQDEEKLEKE